MFDIDPELADLVEPVPTTPQQTGFVQLDEPLFDDFRLEEFTSSTLSKGNTTTTLEKRDGQGRRWIAKSGKWSEPGM